MKFRYFLADTIPSSCSAEKALAALHALLFRILSEVSFCKATPTIVIHMLQSTSNLAKSIFLQEANMSISTLPGLAANLQKVTLSIFIELP